VLVFYSHKTKIPQDYQLPLGQQDRKPDNAPASASASEEERAFFFYIHVVVDISLATCAGQPDDFLIFMRQPANRLNNHSCKTEAHTQMPS
jgi:hypothetical protein